MKITRKSNSLPHASLKRSGKQGRGIRRRSEFQKYLDAYLVEAAEELEDYPVRFPKHGVFWDDGYEDKRLT